VDAEGLQETPDVVPDGLGAQVELGGDLLRRVVRCKKTKHLDLTGVRCGCGAASVSSGRPSNSPKTPTTRSQLAGALPVLERDDGGELATANIAHKPLGRRIDPADDSRCVEDVARDADAVQSLLDVAADFQAIGHHGSVADPRIRSVVVTSRTERPPERASLCIVGRRTVRRCVATAATEVAEVYFLLGPDVTNSRRPCQKLLRKLLPGSQLQAAATAW
jgi:hypothetical protein